MKNFTQKKILDYQESFCITSAIIFAIIITLSFRIYNGCWIPMTVGLMFLATDQGQGAIIQKTRDRAIGTIVGILLSFLFISIFMYGNYRWGYFLPAILFIGTYLFYATGNYAFWTLTITMLVSVCLSICLPIEFSVTDLLFKRIVCTFLGITIAILAEYIIYRKAASIYPKMKNETIDFFYSQGEIIELSTMYFHTIELDIQEFNLKFSDRVWTHINKMNDMERMFAGIKNEFDYDNQQEAFYQYFFSHMMKISRISRKLLTIAGHEKFDFSILKIDELKSISDQLTYKYSNILKYFYGENDNSTKRIKLILNDIDIIEKKSTTYLYLKTLYKLSVLADEISNAVQNSKLILP